MNGSTQRCERNILRSFKSRVSSFKNRIRLYPSIIEDYVCVPVNNIWTLEDNDMVNIIVNNLSRCNLGTVSSPCGNRRSSYSEMNLSSDSEDDSDINDTMNDSDYEEYNKERSIELFHCKNRFRFFDIMPSESDFLWFNVKRRISNESFEYLSEIYYEFKILISKLRESGYSKEVGTPCSSNNKNNEKVRKLSELASIAYFFNDLLPNTCESEQTHQRCTNEDETGFPSLKKLLKKESIEDHRSKDISNDQILYSDKHIRQRYCFEFIISEFLMVIFTNFRVLSPLIPVFINFCTGEFNLLCKYLNKIYFGGVRVDQFCLISRSKKNSMAFDIYLRYLSLKKLDIAVLQDEYFLEKISGNYRAISTNLQLFKYTVKIFEKILSSIPNIEPSAVERRIFRSILYFILGIVTRIRKDKRFIVAVIEFLNKIVNEMLERSFNSEEIEKIQFLLYFNLTYFKLKDYKISKTLWKLSQDLSNLRFIIKISNKKFISNFILRLYAKNTSDSMLLISNRNLQFLLKNKSLNFKNHFKRLTAHLNDLSAINMPIKDSLNLLSGKPTREKSKKIRRKQKLKHGGII